MGVNALIVGFWKRTHVRRMTLSWNHRALTVYRPAHTDVLAKLCSLKFAWISWLSKWSVCHQLIILLVVCPYICMIFSSCHSHNMPMAHIIRLTYHMCFLPGCPHGQCCWRVFGSQGITKQGSSKWGITWSLCTLAVFIVHSIHSFVVISDHVT